MAKKFYFMRGLPGKKASFLSGKAALIRLLKGISRGIIFLFDCGLWSGPGFGAVLFWSMNGTRLGVLETVKSLISTDRKDS